MKNQKILFLLCHYKLFLSICLFWVSACCPMKNWEKADTCSLLKDIVVIEEFKKVFYINLKKDENILIVDTTNFFGNCTFETKYGRKVVVQNQLIQNQKRIMVIQSKQKNNTVELFFYQPIYLNVREMNGPILLLKVKRSRNKNTITDVRCGST